VSTLTFVIDLEFDKDNGLALQDKKDIEFNLLRAIERAHQEGRISPVGQDLYGCTDFHVHAQRPLIVIEEGTDLSCVVEDVYCSVPADVLILIKEETPDKHMYYEAVPLNVAGVRTLQEIPEWNDARDHLPEDQQERYPEGPDLYEDYEPDV
jgi:hypothetical protein